MDVSEGEHASYSPQLMNDLIRNYANESKDIAFYLCQNKSDVNVLRDLYCGDFPVKHQRAVELFVWAAFSGLIAVALVGNATVMWIIAHCKTMHNSFNLMLFNIALADFLIALLNVGTTWTFNFYFDWWYGDYFCPLNHFFGVAPTSASVFTMMVVSHDRQTSTHSFFSCAAIVDPLGKRAMSRKRACFLIVLIWMFAGLLSFPNFVNARVEPKYSYSSLTGVLSKHRICSNDFHYKFLYDNTLFVVQYAIPLLVLTYTYVRILLAFRNIKFPSASRVTISRNHMRDKRKAIKMLGFVVIIFMVSWLPYQLYHILSDFFMKNALVGVYTYLVFYFLAMTASAVNPLIYFCFNHRFRLGFKYVFRFFPFVNFANCDHNEMFGDLSRSAMLSVRMRQVQGPTPGSPLHPKSSSPTHNRPHSPTSATSLTLN
ncbi:G-PROTEIN-RECEP-F1-2 domain-containing protein [Aphelenchoides fujianensis]|nr:G-PROTEIN-RECEP-F1-2 domain-containing protein [Aphelenchoides fujianensis]